MSCLVWRREVRTRGKVGEEVRASLQGMEEHQPGGRLTGRLGGWASWDTGWR